MTSSEYWIHFVQRYDIVMKTRGINIVRKMWKTSLNAGNNNIKCFVLILHEIEVVQPTAFDSLNCIPFPSCMESTV